MNRPRRSQCGFTLIELLIVVAIVGVLAAIAIPMFNFYVIRGYNTAANADLRNFKVAVESVNTATQSYPDL